MNILFLFTDQQSNFALSCAGNPYLSTPHMDSLANSGARFEQVYCAAPVCGPSRACVATGRMPHENGVLVNGMSIPPEMPTMGEIFRDGGYRTAWAGRWCVPDNGLDIRGFDSLHDTSQPLGQGMFADSHVADCAKSVAQPLMDQFVVHAISFRVARWVPNKDRPFVVAIASGQCCCLLYTLDGPLHI